MHFPALLPREPYEATNRWTEYGDNLFRLKDRKGNDMLLGPTHEEMFTLMVKGEYSSYKDLPLSIYQIQTKYRDEARPRAGLIRVREFTMKDGYSFHDSQDSLESYYWRCHEAYERFFRRVGMKQVVSIESDTGMMGGSKAHEFMAVSEIGEDTIFLSPDGTYRANKEVATTALKFVSEAPLPLEPMLAAHHVYGDRAGLVGNLVVANFDHRRRQAAVEQGYAVRMLQHIERHRHARPVPVHAEARRRAVKQAADAAEESKAHGPV